jgi:TM2 domain-containing membrane protein YozV
MTESNPEQFPPTAPQAPQEPPVGQQAHPQQYAQQPGTHQMPFQVYPQAQPQFTVQRQPKSRLAAGLFGIFLGAFGIHRFYLGYTAIGVIQLVGFLILGPLTFGLGFLIGLWGLIEGIMILARAEYFRTDAHGIPLSD